LESDTIGQIIFNILIVLFLVLLNGLFVASEFAIVKVRSSRLTQLVNEGSRKARFAQRVTSNLDAYLSACQLGITLASLGLGWVGEPLIAKMIEYPMLAVGVPELAIHTISLAIAFSFITILHIVLGELAPKSFAIQKSETAVLWLSPPLMIFYKVTYPAIWILNHLSNLTLKIFGLEPASDHEQAHTEEEIKILVNESQKSGLIDHTERVLFDNVFQFSDRFAREAMLPRTSAVVLYVDAPFEENLKTVSETRHTRYPVAKGDKDNIIGFIHVTDLYNEAQKIYEKNMENVVREVLTVPESMELSHVLRLMQKKRNQLAIVVDEYGGTAGLLTLEDILEEIVGEIQDEFDEERTEVQTLENGYSIDGRMLIEDINNLLNTDISNEEVDTVGGWMYMILEDKAEVGQKVDHDSISFEIAEMDRHRVVRILINKNNSDLLAQKDEKLVCL
jgi:CBS domain containing-hemolysin-like protein